MGNPRRNSMHIPASPLPTSLQASGRLPSGLLLDTFSSDENRDAGVEAELAEDEEFAAEEHAHRYRVAGILRSRCIVACVCRPYMT